jgi:glycosyltransferase involved in cell wall biosynthesis
VELRIVGYTCDDDRLNAFDCVSITGRYEEAELLSLIERQEAHLGLFPAVWPETWSYVLTKMWQAGLRVVAFDIGAPAERIRAVMGGYVIPLETSPRFLAHSLMNIALGG